VFWSREKEEKHHHHQRLRLVRVLAMFAYYLLATCKDRNLNRAPAWTSLGIGREQREWTIELQFNADYPSRAKRASPLLLMFSSHKQRHVNAHLTLKMKIICMHTSSPGQWKMQQLNKSDIAGRWTWIFSSMMRWELRTELIFRYLSNLL